MCFVLSKIYDDDYSQCLLYYQNEILSPDFGRYTQWKFDITNQISKDVSLNFIIIIIIIVLWDFCNQQVITVIFGWDLLTGVTDIHLFCSFKNVSRDKIQICTYVKFIKIFVTEQKKKENNFKFLVLYFKRTEI